VNRGEETSRKDASNNGMQEFFIPRISKWHRTNGKKSLRCFSHHLSSNVNLILPYQVTQLSSVLSQHVIYHRLIRHSDQ
jgi:hypothetical protein